MASCALLKEDAEDCWDSGMTWTTRELRSLHKVVVGRIATCLRIRWKKLNVYGIQSICSNNHGLLSGPT